MRSEVKSISKIPTAKLSERETEDRVQKIHAAAKERPLMPDEKIFLLDSAKITNVRLKQEPSVRREDWYGEDGLAR